MNAIALHITYLLRQHDCVIVPGFGAFIKERTQARISEDGSLIPPTSYICFNGAIVNNDGTLVNSVARREQIPFESALAKVQGEIAAWRHTLASESSLSLRGIGKFSMNEDGKLQFKPAFSGKLLNRRLGRLPIPSVAIKQEIASSPQEAPYEISRFRPDKNYYIAINKTFAKVAASLAVLLMVAAAVTMPFMDSLLHPSNAPVQQTASVVPVIKNTQKETPKAEAPEEAIAETGVSETLEETSIEMRQEGWYYLIIGAFATQEEALKFMADNAGNGYELSMIPSTKVIRVSAGKSTDRNDLRELKSSPAFSALYPQAWIL